ncbi:MAG: SDR family oxidoreductase [Planctomycetota bacterium]
MNSRKILVVGAGYLGSRVLQRLNDRGNAVAATSRRRQKLESWASDGIEGFRFDWCDARSYEHLPRDFDDCLIAVAYDRKSRLARHDFMVGGLRRLLSHLNQECRITMISTTGVYHQTNGEWVDETSPTHPSRDSARAHLQAECELRAKRPQNHCVLRMSGLYGPNRLPRANDIRQGKPIASIRSGFLNLIHIDDAASATVAAIERNQRENLYLISDDCPVERHFFYSRIAKLLRLPEPEYKDPKRDSPKAFRSLSDKRVWNRRMKRDLLARLDYPTYVEGLDKILLG